MEDPQGSLYSGKVLLGRFYCSQDDFPDFGQDFPYIGFQFEATPEFFQFKVFFDDVIGALHTGDSAREEKNWRKINSFSLILNLEDGNKKFRVRAPIEPGETPSLFEKPQNAHLYIDNKHKKAWFRLW